MKRETAVQREWNRSKNSVTYDHNGKLVSIAALNRRQFNALWQKAYRRGMERAAGVADQASVPGDVALASQSTVWVSGREAAVSRIRRFIQMGAKDE